MKVLIVKIGAIGDVVMALPILQKIRQSGNSEITWLCGKTVSPLVRMAQVDQIFEIDDKKLLTGNIFDKIYTLIQVWLKLFGKKYDLILIGHGNPLYKLLIITTFRKQVRNFSHKNRLWPVPGRFHGNEYVRLVTNFDGPDILLTQYPQIHIPEQFKFDEDIKPEKIIIAIAPGGAKNLLADDALRRWPLDNYVHLANAFLNKGFQVILTGSKTDEWVLKGFQDLNVWNYIGKTSLAELIYLYQQCDVVITHDSGPLHLAGLAGCPVVALFGPTNPNEKVPRSPNIKVLWGGAHLACRPCYDGKFYADCSNNLCMQDISVDMVVNEVLGFIDKNKPNWRSTH